ncbi:MAG: ABC transporter permease [Chloroflexi bacterium]|nr:ABC transporter permease [Chloroflexota bacterium]
MMRKLWLVAAYEYRRQVLQKGFLLTLLSVPLFIAFLIGIGTLSANAQNKAEALGYVDLSGFLAQPIPAPPRAISIDNPDVVDPVPLAPYASEEAARAALDAEEIQAYYVLPAGYPQTRKVRLVYVDAPGRNATAQFWDLVQINGLEGVPLPAAQRAVAGSSLSARWPGDQPGIGREFSASNFLGVFLPMGAALAFMLLMFMASGYLMQAVTEEKESRTIEVMMTSITPSQLMTGKVLGLALVTLTQLAAWIAIIVAAVIVGRDVFGLGLLQGLTVDFGVMWPVVLLALLTFIMVAALMTAVGATAVEAQQAQQMTGLFVLPVVAPFWLAYLLIEAPDSPLAVALTIFPITSFTTYSLRVSFAQVPQWQLFTALALLTMSALAALWIAGRAFRLGMLRFGQPLPWRALLPGRASARREGGRHG